MIVKLHPFLEDWIKSMNNLINIVLKVINKAADTNPPKYRKCRAQKLLHAYTQTRKKIVEERFGTENEVHVKWYSHS